MKPYNPFYIIILALLTSIYSHKISAQKMLDLPIGASSSLPRFTTDHLGHPVMSWVEIREDQPVLYFSTSSDGESNFTGRIEVPTPAGTSLNKEGRPKLAFKKDGTLLATFEVSRATSDAPRAGDIVYIQSTDGGRTWTQPIAVGTGGTPSRSFGDIYPLTNGEIGAVWLGEKLPGQEGRTVKFAQTRPGGGFGPEVLIDSSACQCCRTSITVDNAGAIHLAYRDICPDGSRDMSYVSSMDGTDFTQPRLLYTDQWKINACPHSGPQLVPGARGIWAAWYSGAEHNEGIRLAELGTHHLTEQPVSSTMKFPQMATWTDGTLALCWEEWVGEGEGAYRKIGLKLFHIDGTSSSRYLTGPAETATLPTLLATPHGLLLAYTQLEETTTRVVVCYLDRKSFKEVSPTSIK